MGVGDTFTIAGVYGMERNPNRRWWQFWRPRCFAVSELQIFTVVRF
jgi:hypothetical protein